MDTTDYRVDMKLDYNRVYQVLSMIRAYTIYVINV